MACPPGTFRFSFNATNPEAVAWIRAHAAELVTQVTDETKAGIRAVILRAFEHGIPPKQAAQIIRGMVGLTERDADAAIRRWWRELRQAAREEADQVFPLNTPISELLSYISPEEEARLARRFEKHRDKLHRRRALTIARTETMRASNEGQQQLWRQAVDAGHLQPTMHKVWIAAIEPGRTCDECEEMNEQTTPMLELFDNGIDNPPLHPNCRCTTGLVDDPTPKAYSVERTEQGVPARVRELATGTVIDFVRDAVGRLVSAVARRGA